MPAAVETAEQRRRREEEEALLALLFLYDESTISYYTRSGIRVPQSTIRRAVAAVLDTARADVQALGRNVAAGDIDVAEWQEGMARRLKTLHLTTASIAGGGLRNMNAGAVASVEETLRFHIVKLEGFAADVAEGVTRLRSFQIDSETGELQEVVRIVRMTDSRIIARAEMYVEAALSESYEGGRRDAAVLAGFAFERNILNPADHCEQCVEETAKGWVGIGELVPIGQRQCLTRCVCQMQFARELPA